MLKIKIITVMNEEYMLIHYQNFLYIQIQRIEHFEHLIHEVQKAIYY